MLATVSAGGGGGTGSPNCCPCCCCLTLLLLPPFITDNEQLSICLIVFLKALSATGSDRHTDIGSCDWLLLLCCDWLLPWCCDWLLDEGGEGGRRL